MFCCLAVFNVWVPLIDPLNYRVFHRYICIALSVLHTTHIRQHMHRVNFFGMELGFWMTYYKSSCGCKTMFILFFLTCTLCRLVGRVILNFYFQLIYFFLYISILSNIYTFVGICFGKKGQLSLVCYYIGNL